MESFDKLTEIYIEDLKKTPAYKTYRDKLKALKKDTLGLLPRSICWLDNQ